jgi:hypothetical protein
MWVASLDAESPPGFIRLAGCSITGRSQAAKNPGSDLVPVEGPSEVERLLYAFAKLDGGGRGEILRHVEQLAGVA